MVRKKVENLIGRKLTKKIFAMITEEIERKFYAGLEPEPCNYDEGFQDAVYKIIGYLRSEK